MTDVLVVDDEPGIRQFIGEVLRDAGCTVTLAADGEEAIQLLSRRSYHLMLTDLQMPRKDGMEVLRHARAEQPEMQVVVLTAHGTVQSAVEAMKLGAFDYLSKPLSGPEEIELLLERALERRRLQGAGERQRRAAEAQDDFVAADPRMTPVLDQLRRVARTDATVLLTGESGTGKEVAARAVHRWSARHAGPFVAVNCATMSDTLLESELFGHEKGAFTGATHLRQGRIELAEGGTLFLDEVGELKPELQAKLLRVLQEKVFERVGGGRPLQADVRWVAATNRDLGSAMADGTFREDLYHRLAVFPVALPPLRERPGDLEPLSHHLLARAGERLSRPGLELSPAALRKLQGYRWPGNVRELSNALERAAILSDGLRIEPDALLLGVPGSSASGQGAAGGAAGGAAASSLVDAEKQAIRRALDAEDGNRKRTAERLGISLRSLYDKLKTHGLN